MSFGFLQVILYIFSCFCSVPSTPPEPSEQQLQGFFRSKHFQLMQLNFCKTGKACGLLDTYVCISSFISADAACSPKMKEVLANFPFAKVNTFVIIVVSFVYNILLDRNVACNCKNADRDCYVYMFLPCGIFISLMLWTDKTCHRASKYTFACSGKCCRSSFIMFLVGRVFMAVSVGLLWVVTVLVDGDWYVCCLNDKTDQQKVLACKDKSNIFIEIISNFLFLLDHR